MITEKSSGIRDEAMSGNGIMKTCTCTIPTDLLMSQRVAPPLGMWDT